jgi:hypothetical protein
MLLENLESESAPYDQMFLKRSDYSLVSASELKRCTFLASVKEGLLK